MVLPLLALGGMAVGAGVKGVQNYIQGQEQEKEAKKAAMRSLYNNMMHDPKHAVGAPIPEAPGVGETVVAPMLQTAAQSALSSGLSSGLGAKKVGDAAQTALAATPPPSTEAYTNAQAAQNQSLQDYFKKPPQPGY